MTGLDEQIVSGPVVDQRTVNGPIDRGVVHTLADGGRVLVRTLEPGDRDELAARYEQLSEASRRLRFFHAPEHLTARVLDQLLALDGADRVAIAARMLDEPGTPGVGVARYARSHLDPTTAEAAAVVLDTHQHRGIGTLLLITLVELAGEHDIATFTASVKWENQPLLASLRAYGAVVTPDEPGVAAVSVSLASPEEPTPSRVKRLLHAILQRPAMTSPRAAGSATAP